MELLVVITLSLFFSVINMIQVFAGALAAPKNTLYIGITHWYEDYFFYLSHLTQGASGLWQTQNWYTTEALPPNPAWWTNIILGKLGGVLALDPWVTYRSALFILSLILIVTIYHVCRKLFPDNTLLRLGCFFLTLTGTSFFAIVSTKSGWSVEPYVFFFSANLSLNRLGGTVHQMTANILSLILLLLSAQCIDFFVKRRQERTMLPLLAVPLVSFLLAMLQPVAGVVIGGSVGLVALFILIKKKTSAFFLQSVFLGVLLGLPVILACLLFLTLTQHPFYAFTVVAFEKQIPPAPLLTLLLSVGAIVLFVPFGFLTFVKKNSTLQTVGALYGLLPVLLYLSPVPRLIGLQYGRILQPESQVFLSAMAMVGMGNIAAFLHKKIRIISPNIVIAAILCCIAVIEAPTLLWETKKRLQSGSDFRYLNTIPKDLYDGLTFLKGKPFGNVIAPYMESQFVPVVAGKPVYAAHRMMTIDYDRKLAEASNFFTVSLPARDAKDFFSKNSIRYVVLPAGQSDQERFETAYSFLSPPLWAKETLAVYEVK